MSEPVPASAQRRLAAIMFLDMCGYSALMSQSESQALSRVKELEAILRARIPAAGGRLIKSMGDGTMAEFPTAGGAVSCAREVLEAIAARNAASAPEDRFEVRVGIHLGELVCEDGDIFGDAVNIAARIISLADPGGIAMTGTVHAQVKNQVTLRGVFLAPTKLKNIPERMRIFLLPPPGTPYALWAVRKKGLPVAVLAFVLAALGLGGWAAWRFTRQPVPSMAMVLVRPMVEGDKAIKLSKDLQDMMTFKGARLRGAVWKDRDLLFASIGKEDQFNLESGADFAKVERRACLLAYQSGVDLSLSGRLFAAGDRWRFDFAITDNEETAVVASFTVEGRDDDELAERVLAKVQDWLNAYKRPEGD